MIRGCLLVASFVVAAGCMKTSATYCARHGAEDPENCPPGDAAGETCMSNTDCADVAGRLVCNLEVGSCVQCNAASAQTTACEGPKPVCGADDTCRACISHIECPSSVCLPNGRCGNEDEVLFVVGSTTPSTNTACTRQSPCDKVQKALAVVPQRSYIKISGTLIEAVVVNNRDVTLLAAVGAMIANSANDTTVLAVTGSSHVDVHDLQIGDGNARTLGVRLDTAAGGSLLLHRVRIADNFSGGISAVGGQLSVLSSTISDNIKGGIVVRSTAGKFDIRNNFIYSNGTGSGTNTTLYGGVLIEADAAGKLEFNTVAFNEGNGLQNRSGIACYGASNSANGNLAYGNRDGVAGPDSALQIGGNCPTGTSFALGSGDLGFRNPSPATPDFHLTALSPSTVVDAGGMCKGSNGVDIDGQARPDNGACDVGADELDTP
ncbi:MAG: right-handed parallel beta-helix repeat-containing protein [Deltaproteobacteria bacterium]|nr:right-handed parallel beta-helix repeat-containing protein [Deltaproteobacteria bacterium]